MPTLEVIKGPMKGEIFEIRGETVFVGRSAKNDVQIHDGTISRKQVKIFRIGKKLFVEDLKSTNGTLINGELIVPGEGFEVSDGDTISIGNTVMRLTELPPQKVLEKKRTFNETARYAVSTSLPEERRSRSFRELELIFKITELLRGSPDVDEMLERVLVFLFETLPRIDRAAIVLYDEKTGELGRMVSRTREEVNDEGVSYSRTVMNRVIEDGKAVRMSDTNYEEPSGLTEGMNTLLIRSVLCVPMISNKKARGAIYVDSLRGPYGFRKEDLLLLNSLSGPVAVAIENAQLEGRL